MLDIKKENLSKSKIKLAINVPSALMVGYATKIYNQIAPSVEVKGFRKGMAPKHLTITAFGEARLMQEILDAALSDTYGQALKQEEVLPVSAPKVNITMMKDILNDNAELKYEVEVEILPEVKIGDYKKFKLKKSKEEIKVTDDEVNEVLTHLQRQHATFADTSGEAQEGDRVEIDFTGSEKGVELENYTSKNYPVILGSKVLLPEFEKNLLGLKAGEGKEFEAKVGPEKRKIHFKVKVNDVKKVILPVLDNELAQKFQKPTIDELRKAINVDILAQKEIAAHQVKEGQIIEQILKITDVEVPESLIDQEIHRMIDDMRQRTAMSGLSFEQYLAQIKKTEEDLHKDLHEQAENTVKIGLALGEIAKAEKIDLKDKNAGKLVVEKLIEYAER